MATATNVQGTAQATLGFVETITSGVINTVTIPATINQTVTYTNGTGAGQVDLAVAKQYTLNAAATIIDLNSIADLSGSSVTFARVREFVVQNIGSADVKVYAYSLSGVAWLPGSASTLYARAASTSSASSGGMLRISDPLSVGATGNLVVSSAAKIAFDPGASSSSVYVQAIGGSATS